MGFFSRVHSSNIKPQNRQMGKTSRQRGYEIGNVRLHRKEG